MFAKDSADLYAAYISENRPAKVPKEYEGIVAKVDKKVGWYREIKHYEHAYNVKCRPTMKSWLHCPAGLTAWT